MQLFKRNGYYQIEYFDESLQRLRKKSLKTKIKNEAIIQLTNFNKSIIQTGLSNKLHFHGLCHSFASNLVQKGGVSNISHKTGSMVIIKF